MANLATAKGKPELLQLAPSVGVTQRSTKNGARSAALYAKFPESEKPSENLRYNTCMRSFVALTRRREAR